MKLAQQLPSVIGETFLAGDGFVGYRCPRCAYVATGRSMEAVQAAYWEHEAIVHLQADPSVPHSETTE